MNYRRMPAVLSIAGSDCSGGAGIQADIKTIEANMCYAMTAITSLTAQNTTGVRGISDVSPDFLRLQLDACFDDIRPDAVKLGMVSDSGLIRVIAEVLRKRRAENIILDPVMVSTSGSKLLKDEAVDVLKSELIPLASLITPNIPEAELLTGIDIKNREDMVTAGTILSDRYNISVLIKGGHSIDDANDILVEGKEVTIFAGERIDNDNTHGTGCTLSSAIAAGLARGLSMTTAIRSAKEYISGALKYGINLGMGSGPLNHIWNKGSNKKLHKCLAKSLILYGVTDGTDNSDGSLYNKVEAAIRGGITFLQLREKAVTEEQYIRDAMAIKTLADFHGIPFLINDNVPVALASGADGVHLGQDDMDISEARIILGDDKIIGATAHSVEEAIRAEQLGADYLGVGAMYKTSTKDNTVPVTYDILREICHTVSIPVVAIAGINENNVSDLAGSGIAGAAVVSAIFGSEDITAAAKRMKAKTVEMLYGFS
ncbi:MAG: bifunctional hydroxymethylpyrimidine kinase/phosphomethylpyrimidine kinase [Wujia sp.]